jgi:hypothetical protein
MGALEWLIRSLLKAGRLFVDSPKNPPERARRPLSKEDLYGKPHPTPVDLTAKPKPDEPG